MTHNSLKRKPKLVFFQYKYGETLPAFLLMHKQEHAKCLSQFFDVQVIAEDCDYSAVCDKHEPDLVLFESGVPLPSCRRLNITGVRGSDRVPKLGFLHADGFCCGRAGFLSDMDQWGIQTFFAIASAAAEHTPQLQDNLFIWPNFVDEELYRDYSQYKSIPVLFTGNKNSMYPWRQAILQRVAKRYPSLVCPHSGYAPGASSARMVVGEPYARMLNAAWFVPACGGVAKELVRKHLEIPACNACLIAERTPVLEAAGFVDMVNCVFADPDTVVDKMDVLFRDEERLSAVIAEGYKLVHSRHTMKHRDQVFQWYMLHKQLRADQRIVQRGPFEQPVLVDKANEVTNFHLTANGSHLSLLRDGDKRLEAGDAEGAERAYLKCLSFISYMPEPQLKLAICNLLKGKPKQALFWINKPLYFTLVEYAAKDPDPVEWAYYLIALLCNGEASKATEQAVQFSWLDQKELCWTRAIVEACVGSTSLSVEALTSTRASIHQLPERSFQQWTDHVHALLRACGQNAIAERLQTASKESIRGLPIENLRSSRSDAASDRGHSADLRRAVSSIKKREETQRRRQKLKQTLRKILHNAESRFGYFLPFRMSSARTDELVETIQQLIRDREPRRVLAIGACAGGVIGEAIIAVARESRSRPSLVLIGPAPTRGIQDYDTLKSIRIAREVGYAAKDDVLQAINGTGDDETFDLLVIDGAAIGNGCAPSDILLRYMQSARFVFLINLQQPEIHMAYLGMLEDCNFMQVQQNPISWRGYAFFERLDHSTQMQLSLDQGGFHRCDQRSG